MRIVTASEMKQMDEYAIRKIGIPGVVLMENAGQGVFETILRREGSLKGKRIGIFCGTGNNGGDGFVIARHVKLAKAHPEVFVIGSSELKKGETRTNFQILERMGISSTRIRSTKAIQKVKEQAKGWDLIVDAIFGTGLSRPLKPLHAACVDFINEQKKKGVRVYSVDIPSGLHADTGEIMGSAVHASVTVTFALKKRGFYFGLGPSLCGEVEVAKISMDEGWADEIGAQRLFETNTVEVQSWFPKRAKGSHKGTFGHVLVLAGSPQKSGAAILTSRAALRAGAGLVTLAVPASAHTVVKSQLVEVMTEPLPDDGDGNLDDAVLPHLLHHCQGKQALVIGPGLIPGSGLPNLLQELFLRTSIPIVLDADGLNSLGKNLRQKKAYSHRLILTPHPGEMSRIVGKSTKEIQENRLGIARDLSDTTHSTVILKGANTIVALGNGDTYINPTGNPGMATAGMGDVLAGVIGAYLAQGLTKECAAIAGAFHHGLAGDRVAQRKGPRGLLATDVIEEFPQLSI